MEFTSKTALSHKNVIGSGKGAKVHQITAGAVTGLDIGHVIVITKEGIQGRWDGITLPDDGAGAAVPYRLAIVTRKQFAGDGSVTALVKGDYVRENVVLADDSALPAEAQFMLTLSDLWAEGEW
ncbi:hypothetical protein [Vibrio parahaemolyticus]|uniref:hypothetical protein n=1 Tax=Vibrio parahaemolyticus TaxID=670 RepID=UPI001299AC33|nr:hypothetical protein [Vibrio parahaemolyticus]EHK0753614.1 hypothetical protein [Vibrio parahaemolyticus]EJB8443169.1 hypothetical protein [Vibrio parahaemolyticus]MRE01306.1 hypothetical protein [Vibrio parahaemolyticus]